MAFRFFRRRQKMVIVIMVVLMIAFLVGPRLSSMFTGSRAGEVVGRFPDGQKLKVRDFQLAHSDLQMFEFMVQSLPQGPILPELIFLSTNGGDSPFAYGVLIAEAQEAGIRPTEEDVDSFLAGRGVSDAGYRSVVSALRNRDIPEKQFRAAVRRLMMVSLFFERWQIECPPSGPRVKHLAMELAENVNVAIVPIRAEAFLDQLDREYSPDEIQAQFDLYDDVLPRTFASQESYGFGYRLPDRVRIEYMLIRPDRVGAAVQADLQEALAYFSRHESDHDLFETLGIEPPASEPDAPAELKFSDVRDAILRMLTDQKVADKCKAVARTMNLASERIADSNPTGENVYDVALRQTMLSADSVLQRPLTDVRFDDAPLSEVLTALAERVDLAAIGFPYGTIDDETVSPETPVSLTEDDTTLGDVLDRICEKLDYPTASWVRCDAFADGGGVLFAVAPISSLPILTGETELIGRDELIEHPVLGEASTLGVGARQLPDEAFLREYFTSSEAAGNVSSEPQPTMAVGGAEGGVLLWRIVEAKASEAPAELTDEIARRVVDDLKMIDAMALATEAANELLADAAEGSLQGAADSAGYEVVETGPFSRKLWNQQMGLALAPVPGMSFKSLGTRDAIVDVAFAMGRRSLLPAEAGTVVALPEVVALPADRTVCLVGLIEYKPVEIQAYMRAQQIAMGEIGRIRSVGAYGTWFVWSEIARRTGFELRENEAPADE